MNTDAFYYSLAQPREVGRSGVPESLRRFYRIHEGTGLESPPGGAVRLARLDEIQEVTWKDLHIVGDAEPPHEGWKYFAAWRIGYSDMLDDIVHIVRAPGVPTGAVLAIGTGVMIGPAGDDVEGPVGAIMIARSFDDWIRRVERDGPLAHGLFIDRELPDQVAKELRMELARLNPHSDYGR